MRRELFTRVLRVGALAILAACGGRGAIGPVLPAQRIAQPLATGAGPILWTLRDMVRVGPTAPPVNRSREIKMLAARNDAVSFQTVVTAPPGGLSAVRISASAFRDAKGRKAPAILTALYREHFSEVTKASPVHGHPESLGPGIYRLLAEVGSRRPARRFPDRRADRW